MEVHIPNQMEALLQCRTSADITSFDYILKGIKTILKEKDDFIKGLNEDQKKREDTKNAVMAEAKKAIGEALNENDVERGLTTAHAVLSQLEQAYNAVELEYMDNVLTTCTTFDEEDGTAE